METETSEKIVKDMLKDEDKRIDDHEEQMAMLRNQRYNMMRDDMQNQDENEVMEEDGIDYNDAKGNIQTWLRKPEVIKFIRRQFDKFLKQQYEERIHEMCQNNK